MCTCALCMHATCKFGSWKSGQTKPDLLDCLLWPCITRNCSTSVIHNVYDYNYGNTCTRHVQFYGRGRSCSGKAWKKPSHINWTVGRPVMFYQFIIHIIAEVLHINKTVKRVPSVFWMILIQSFQLYNVCMRETCEDEDVQRPFGGPIKVSRWPPNY